jgi:sarcosine oxidase subunit beta
VSATATTYDAIVIGAGSVGCPAAYFLARKGLKVLVLEELDAPGQGQNKAAIGGVRATHSDPAKIQICQQSLSVFGSWKEEHGFDIGWKKGGYCFPVYTEGLEKTLKDLLVIQKNARLNIDWVDKPTIRELVPGIDPDDLRGGTFSPDDGQVSPLLASEGFRRASVELGVEFRYRESVQAAEIQGGAFKSITTNKSTYAGKMMLNAAGARAQQVGEMCGLEVPVTPDSHEAGISAPVAQFLEPLVVDLRPGPEGRTANFYFGQNHEGQIIFCYTPKELFLGEDRENTSEFLPIACQRLARLIPRLRNLLIRRIWRGLYPMTPDGVPIVDCVSDIDGLFLAVGMCGQGFMLGPGVAMNIASLMVDGKPLIAEDIFASMRFKRDFKAGKEALK